MPTPYTLVNSNAAGGSNTLQSSAISATAPAGDFVFAVVGNAGGNTVSNFTDSQNNVYTKQVAVPSGNQHCEIWTSILATEIVSGVDTFTATYSGTSSQKFITARGCTGVLSATADRIADANGSSTAPSSGATTGLSQPAELVIGAIEYASGATLSALSFGTALTNTNGGSVTEFDEIVNSTTAATASGTLSASVTWGAVIATFPLSPAAAVRSASPGKTWRGRFQHHQSFPLPSFVSSVSVSLPTALVNIATPQPAPLLSYPLPLGTVNIATPQPTPRVNPNPPTATVSISTPNPTPGVADLLPAALVNIAAPQPAPAVKPGMQVALVNVGVGLPTANVRTPILPALVNMASFPMAGSGSTPVPSISLATNPFIDAYGNAIPAGLMVNEGQIDGGVLNDGSIASSAPFAAGALNGYTFNGVLINGNTVSAADFIASGTQGGVFIYGTGGTIVQTITSGTTWVVPTGVTSVQVELWGGGGGGGGASSGNAGGGGGGGAYAIWDSYPVTAGHSYAYSIGSGGAGGAAGANGTGGTSTFFDTAGGNLQSGNGGHGFTNGNGGAGGSAFSGSPNATNDGGSGGTGYQTSNNAGGGGGGGSGGTGASNPGNSGSNGGNGNYGPGASAVSGGGPGGDGGRPGLEPHTGSSPFVPWGGGGGGGAIASSTGYAGGNGDAGQIRLTYTSTSTQLICAITGASTTDPLSGVPVPGGIYILDNETLDFQGTATENAHGMISAPAAEELQISAPQTNSTDVVSEIIMTTVASGNIPTIQVTGAIVATTPSTTTAETWHNFNPLSNSWSVPSGGFAKYRLTPQNELQISAYIQAPGSSPTGVTIATFPAGYRPLSTHYVPVACQTLPGSPGYSPQVTIASSGVMQAFGVTNNSLVGIEVKIPLDI